MERLFITVAEMDTARQAEANRPGPIANDGCSPCSLSSADAMEEEAVERPRSASSASGTTAPKGASASTEREIVSNP